MLVGIYVIFANYSDLPGSEWIRDQNYVPEPINSNRKPLTNELPVRYLIGPVLVFISIALFIASRFLFEEDNRS
jgi:hypothetical protein